MSVPLLLTKYLTADQRKLAQMAKQKNDDLNRAQRVIRANLTKIAEGEKTISAQEKRLDSQAKKIDELTKKIEQLLAKSKK